MLLEILVYDIYFHALVLQVVWSLVDTRESRWILSRFLTWSRTTARLFAQDENLVWNSGTTGRSIRIAGHSVAQGTVRSPAIPGVSSWTQSLSLVHLQCRLCSHHYYRYYKFCSGTEISSCQVFTELSWDSCWHYGCNVAIVVGCVTFWWSWFYSCLKPEVISALRWRHPISQISPNQLPATLPALTSINSVTEQSLSVQSKWNFCMLLKFGCGQSFLIRLAFIVNGRQP